MDEIFEKVGKVVLVALLPIFVLALLAAIGIGLAFPIKWTWNATMPAIFGLPAITWGKAWCLHFLAGSLVKSTLFNRKT